MKQKKIVKRLFLRKWTVSSLNSKTLRDFRGGEEYSQIYTCQSKCPQACLTIEPIVCQVVSDECITQAPYCQSVGDSCIC